MTTPLCMKILIKWEPVHPLDSQNVLGFLSVSLLALWWLEETSTFSQHLSSFSSTLEPRKHKLTQLNQESKHMYDIDISFHSKLGTWKWCDTDMHTKTFCCCFRSLNTAQSVLGSILNSTAYIFTVQLKQLSLQKHHLYCKQIQKETALSIMQYIIRHVQVSMVYCVVKNLGTSCARKHQRKGC